MEHQLGGLTLGLELSFIAVVYALVVLLTLALIIKAVTYVARPKKPPTIPPTTTAEVRGVDDVDIALAVTAIHKYLMDKWVSRPKYQQPTPSTSSWVASWRLECSSNTHYINPRRTRVSRQ
ncbi:MAG: hypothetical protein QW820_07555 [Sulfolobales archaeon]